MTRLGSLRFVVGCFAAGVCAVSAIAACSSDSETLSAFSPTGDAGGKSDAGSFTDAGTEPSDAASPIEANGVVIVHAASFGAFRLCFESGGAKQPIPSADLIPESNLPGVQVGSIVRIAPLTTPPQRVWVFAVDDIKGFYPPGKAGPSCDDLVKGSGFQFAHEVALINDDLSRGVNLLVLRGSLEDDDLRLEKITLNAFMRDPTVLPVQVLPLSIDLSARAGNRAIGISAGAIADAGIGDAGDGGIPAPFIEGALPFGKVSPTVPYELDYQPNDESGFATAGFSVTLGAFMDAGADAGDAGPREVILSQSLADIQRLSAPRALPGPWFSAASSYVLLLLGSAQQGDASADELSRLHFIAVPVAAPPTAGDAGEPPPADAAAD